MLLFLIQFVGTDFFVELYVLVFAHWLKPENVALFDIFFTLIYFNNHLLPPPTFFWHNYGVVTEKTFPYLEIQMT